MFVVLGRRVCKYVFIPSAGDCPPWAKIRISEFHEGCEPNGFLRDTVFCLSAAEETVQRRYNVAAHGKLASIAAERGELAG